MHHIMIYVSIWLHTINDVWLQLNKKMCGYTVGRKM